MTEKLYDLAIEIADQLSTINGRSWTVTETPPGREGYEPRPGYVYLNSDDGYNFTLCSDDVWQFRREPDRITASPGAQYHADNSLYTSNGTHDQPVATVAAKRTAAAIARDLNRRAIAPGMAWIDTARTFINQYDDKAAKQHAVKRALADAFPHTSTPQHNSRIVYGRGWHAEVGHGGTIYKLAFTSYDNVLTLETTRNLIAQFETAKTAA
jgi:hypothetical protein